MSYDSSTGIITAPVSIKDVCDALSIPYNSNNADLGFLLTRTSRVNPTARFKPFKGGGVEVQTNLWNFGGGSTPVGWEEGDEYDIDGQGNWSPRATAAFGTLATSLTFDSYGFPNNGTKWTVNPPSGGSSEPFRLSDFNGYTSVPKNSWTLSLVEGYHFAIYQKQTTPAGQNAKFKIGITLYPQASGAVDRYYVRLSDVGLTTTNLDRYSLYIWAAVIVESENYKSGGKQIFAKRTSQNLHTLLSTAYTEIDFNLNENFFPYNDSTSSFVPGTSYLGEIRGPFKIQCFIAPRINNDGFISSKYDSNTIYASYGKSALSSMAANCLSLAGASTGSDIQNFTYQVVDWNTGISFETTNGSVTSTKVGNYYHYNVSTYPNVIIKRSSVSGSYDTISTTVYYKITALLATSGSYSYEKSGSTMYINGGDTITIAENNFTIPVGNQTQSIQISIPNLVGMNANLHYTGSWTISILTSDTNSGYGNPSTTCSATIS